MPVKNAERVLEAARRALGYRPYAVGSRGLLRVATLDGIPDGGCNFLFSAAGDSPRYISYRDVDAIRALSVHADASRSRHG